MTFVLRCISISALFLAHTAFASELVNIRKTAPESLDLRVERRVLDNGMIVLLCPDPSARSVLVDARFNAGTGYEPPKRSGMAHLVEHIIYRGHAADLDYPMILERRGAREVSAYTTPEQMLFRTIVPPKELPLALWVTADRVANLPNHLDPKDFDRHRSVVEVERAQRLLDMRHGAAEQSIYSYLFPSPHPLRSMVIGATEELEQVTLKDVQKFARSYIRPNNAILTIVGRFDMDRIDSLLEQSVAALPPGPQVHSPRTWRRVRSTPASIRVPERLSRRPRLTIVWRIKRPGKLNLEWLEFGALLLSNYIDGAFGTRAQAGLMRMLDTNLFRLDLLLPYEKGEKAAKDEAEVFIRYLTAVDMPRDVFDGTRLAQDRSTLFNLDTLKGRSELVTMLEIRTGKPQRVRAYNERHWRYSRHELQHAAWKNLVTEGKRIVIHSRPTRPLKPKLHWENR